jgi:hypothetical protein
MGWSLNDFIEVGTTTDMTRNHRIANLNDILTRSDMDQLERQIQIFESSEVAAGSIAVSKEQAHQQEKEEQQQQQAGQVQIAIALVEKVSLAGHDTRRTTKLGVWYHVH